MAKVKNLESPMGWLTDPNKKWAIHFDIKNDSKEQIGQEFSIDMWGVDSDGQPLIFKSRRKTTKIDSLKTWNQLISSNWKKLSLNKVKSA